MKYVVLLLLLAFVLIPATASAQPISDKVIAFSEDVSIYMTADVTETTLGLDGQKDLHTVKDFAICSGFVLGTVKTEEIIITARHCVQDIVQDPEDTFTIAPRSVHFFDGDVGAIESIYHSKNFDVAILLVHSNRKHPGSTLEQHFRRGEDLFLMGMPAGNFWSYSSATPMQGEQTVPVAAPFNNMVLIECRSCFNGNSGGAIFNEKGEIIGLLSASTGVNGQFLMTPTSSIMQTLGDLAAIH